MHLANIAKPSFISTILPTAATTIVAIGFVIAGHPSQWNATAILIAAGYCVIVAFLTRILPRYPARGLAMFLAILWAGLLVSSKVDIEFSPALHPYLPTIILDVVSRRLLGWLAIAIPLTVTIHVAHSGTTRMRLLHWIFSCIILTLAIFTIGLFPVLPWMGDEIVTIPTLLFLIVMPFWMSYGLKSGSRPES